MREQRRVLVVDDDEQVRGFLCSALEEGGLTTLRAEDGASALHLIRSARPEAVLLDMQLPDMDGMRVLAEIRRHHLDIPVLVLTGHGSIELAVHAVKSGAVEFLEKPIQVEVLLVALRDALREEGNGPGGGRASRAPHPLGETMGASRLVHQLVRQVDRVARSNLSVLVIGESGTGKELVARAIHGRSRRRDRRFLPLDCGALPPGLVENELFGHQEGAYTGADSRYEGAFEAASGGTLFLDEIGNLPPGAQGSLLRALDEKEVRRLGSTERVRVDLRLVAATNRRPEELLEQGVIRHDLYHRLAEFEIEVPPLRDRLDDLPFLVDRFVREANADCDLAIGGPSAEAGALLSSYGWPGNVRELRNVIRRAVILAEERIEPDHLTSLNSFRDVDPAAVMLDPALEDHLSLKDAARRAAMEVERRLVANVLARTAGNKARAARILKVDYKTLHKKVREYGIRV